MMHNLRLDRPAAQLNEAMSDEQAIHLTFAVPELSIWAVAAMIFELSPAEDPEAEPDFTPDDPAYTTALNESTYTVQSSRYCVVLTPVRQTVTADAGIKPEHAAAWKKRVADIIPSIGARAYSFRRVFAARTFREILGEYYARRDAGDKPNLREMARSAHVNYASLRQAKIRYDEKRRANASPD